MLEFKVNSAFLFHYALRMLTMALLQSLLTMHDYDIVCNFATCSRDAVKVSIRGVCC